MNFLPRSVAIGPNSMGNKLYKLHVRHESAKETLSVAPDTSIGQLKGLIGAKFQVQPSQLVLFCNGKLLQAEETSTLRQARVCNGSKILASKVGAGGSAEPSPKAAFVDVEERARREQIRREVAAREREAALAARLEQAEREAEELSGQVAGLGGVLGEGEELAARRTASKVAGERLMRLLEGLDNISLESSMYEFEVLRELRSKRKKVATKLNIILDLNDANIQAIGEAMKKDEGS